MKPARFNLPVGFVMVNFLRRKRLIAVALATAAGPVLQPQNPYSNSSRPADSNYCPCTLLHRECHAPRLALASPHCGQSSIAHGTSLRAPALRDDCGNSGSGRR